MKMENCCLITLIEKFKGRDISAFPIIFGEFEGLIRIYTARLDGEDAFQELTVFLLELLYKINASAFKRDNSDTLKRYIAVSIRNKYIALSKQRDIYLRTSYSLIEDLTESGPDFWENHILKEALNGLPPKQRQVILYKYIYDYSDIETAAFLGITRQAVNRLKNRAMENLREYYSGGF